MAYFATSHNLNHARYGWTSRLARHLNVWRQRRQLTRLDDAALSDIGISRAEAETEARRQIWDAPENWRC